MNDYEREHLEALRKHLCECTVLLKKNGDFPLEKPCTIAAYGPGVRHTVKGGTGSGEVNTRTSVSIEEGLKEAGFEVTGSSWLDHYDELYRKTKMRHLLSIKKEARQNRTLAVTAGMGRTMDEPEYYFPFDGEGDTAIYVLRRISGEGSDRSEADIRLSQTEIRDILTLNHQYSRFMLVVNSGGYVDLSPVQNVDNILLLSQLGTETGHALADLLLGKTYPSGKLAASWAKAEDYYRDNGFGNRDDSFYKEGIYVGYRYFDTADKGVLYPFGFGLGYTEFEISNPSFRQNYDCIEVTCTVTNTGSLAGKETVQLYVSLPEGKLKQHAKQLCAFIKTKELQPKESQEVTLSFSLSSAASYDTETESYILEEGTCLLYLGNSSRDIECIGGFHLEKTICVQMAENSLEPIEDEELKLERGDREIPSTVIEADLSLIKKEYPHEYDEKPDEELSSLDDRTLALTNIGAFSDSALEIVGNGSKSVAGAAGETYGGAVDHGFPVLVMADGPAGLRLSRQYYIDHKQRIRAVGSTIPETVGELLPGFITKAAKLFESKPKKRHRVYEQYATAIPIATAIAQSFNPELAYLCGDIIGEEMELFHVDLWLGPGMNIQRDVRCGRNYEYYSEDPYLTGIMAASIVNGIQKHRGKGAVIKHFACNNQETNRYNNNSIVSERAFREIYLKGFAIAIEKSRPYGLMTSYNLLNGTHTSEHKGLLINILRKQLGYTGIVMTDWVTAGFLFSRNAKYRSPDAALVAAASNDLFMPGSSKELRQIMRGLKKGTVTRKQLLENASRIRRVHKEMNQEK